jgi:hypothetical protein
MYGVAFAEMTLAPFLAPMEDVPPAASEASFIKNLMNFYPTEATSFGRQSWARPDAAFDCEPGELSFWWHSFAGAEVEIFLDDVAIQSRIQVSSDWERHTVLIPSTGSPLRRLRFGVAAKQLALAGDTRELAISLGKFSLKK